MVMHAIALGLRFREVVSHIAKLFWALRKPVLPSFPFFGRQQVIGAAVDRHFLDVRFPAAVGVKADSLCSH
jgi:hypothetical protein